MSKNICLHTVERLNKNYPLPTYYYNECGCPAKYRIYYNRWYNRRDKEPEEIFKDVCGRHLNVYKKALDTAKESYRIEKL